MAKDPAFLFYPGDYLRDTQCLSEKCQVAYDRIMCEHMRNICISHQQLKFFTKRLSEDEIEELKMVLTESADGFQITWVAESIVKRREYSESRRKNRTSSGTKKKKKISSTYVKHMENENEDVTVIYNESSKEDIRTLPVFFQNEELNKWFVQWLKVCEEKGKPRGQSNIESLQMQLSAIPVEQAVAQVKKSAAEGWVTLHAVDTSTTNQDTTKLTQEPQYGKNAWEK